MTQATLDLFGPLPPADSPSRPVPARGAAARHATAPATLRLGPARPAGVTAAWRRWLRPLGDAGRDRGRAGEPLPDRTPPGADTRSGFDTVGFEIGWDHAHHRVAPPLAHFHPGHPVREGWDAGCARFGSRTLRATPTVRRWLALRLEAWSAGLSFDALHVTPHLLDRLAVGHCPVTRAVLTEGAGGDDEAVVARVDARVGYQPGNLAVVGRRAQVALERTGFREAIAQVERLEADRSGEPDALGATAWARLAVLTSFVTPLPHDEAARLPLLVLPPPRVPVVNPAQALQVLLTTQLMRPGYARRLADLAGRVTSPTARRALQVFMHTLLARRVALGAQPDPIALRHGLEDAWRHPLVNQRWQAFSLAMTPAACERLLRHGVAPGDAVQVTPDAALG